MQCRPGMRSRQPIRPVFRRTGSPGQERGARQRRRGSVWGVSGWRPSRAAGQRARRDRLRGRGRRRPARRRAPARRARGGRDRRVPAALGRPEPDPADHHLARPAHRPALRRPHPPDTAREHLHPGSTDGRSTAGPPPRRAEHPPARRPASATSTPNGRGSSPVSTPHRRPTAAPWPASEGVDDDAADPTHPGRSDARRTRADETTPARPRTDRTAGCRTPPTSPAISLNRRRTDEPSLLDGLDTFGADLPDDGRSATPRRRRRRCRGSRSTRSPASWRSCSASSSSSSRRCCRSDAATWSTLLGFTAVVAGAVTLVWRLRSGDDDDDFDDGAVV